MKLSVDKDPTYEDVDNHLEYELKLLCCQFTFSMESESWFGNLSQ